MNVGYTPVELFAGYVVYLIERYINDRNINLAKLATDALYTILQYKEPRKMAGMYKLIISSINMYFSLIGHKIL